MDRGSVSTTMRARKVIYDEYTGAFYVETRVEALERQVATRAKMTDVLNRSQDSKLRTQKKRDQAAMDIFDRKFEKEGLTHKEALKDHMAHYGVLRELAQERENSGNSDPNMGRYGPGTSKLEIQPLIQNKIKESTPSAKRRRQSKKILATRKNIKNKVHVSLTEYERENSEQTHFRAATADIPVHHGVRPQTTFSGGRPRRLRLPAIDLTPHHRALGTPPDRPRTDQEGREDPTQRSGPTGQRLHHRGKGREDTADQRSPGPSAAGGASGQQRFHHRFEGLT